MKISPKMTSDTKDGKLLKIVARSIITRMVIINECGEMDKPTFIKMKHDLHAITVLYTIRLFLQ